MSACRRSPFPSALYPAALIRLSLTLGLGLSGAGCTPPPSAPPTSLPSPTPLASAAPSPAPTASPTAEPLSWPTDGWPTARPEEQGMDAARLAEMDLVIERDGVNLHSLLIIRHGYLVSEKYYRDYDANRQNNSYSCAKSVIGTLVGIALDQGYLQRLEQRVVDFFPGQTFANPDERKQAMTLEDLLTMRTGLEWADGPQMMEDLPQADGAQYMLDRPMAGAAGAAFNYCSGCSHILSAILQQATGMNTRAFADENLFQPLGITQLSWDTDATGVPLGGFGLSLTARDMAKLGYLYLREGRWEDEQIVSRGWIARATQWQATPAANFMGDEYRGPAVGYGYQWWVIPEVGVYAAYGYAGQYIWVAPALDLVVVTTAEEYDENKIPRLLLDYILPAVNDGE